VTITEFLALVEKGRMVERLKEESKALKTLMPIVGRPNEKKPYSRP